MYVYFYVPIRKNRRFFIKTDYVFTTNNVDNSKTRRAKQLGIPLIDVDYVYQYRSSSSRQMSIDINKFLIKSSEDQENFAKTGTITVAGSIELIAWRQAFLWLL